jgi:hypothetical protein
MKPSKFIGYIISNSLGHGHSNLIPRFMTTKNNKLYISTLTNMGIKFEGKKRLERCKKEEIELN